MRLASTLALIALPLSLAKNISISVGEDGLVFNPDTVTADTGDLLQFYFYPKDHSVAQSSFSSPCQPLTGGVYSGFLPETAEGKTVFQVTVNNTDPIYLYCSQIQHCQAGMAMVVNPPSTGNTLAAYQSAAKTASTASPPAIAGGVFIDASEISNSTSNTTAASTTASPSATSSTSSTTSPTSSTVPSKGGAVGNAFVQWGLLGGVGIGGFALAMI
ncbi:MAG: hypothetical protein ALECFALPRED_004509 [Alectoria fallacina]|uniref:Phytocyanin domain-containing protein n=1 Tax=Alectoria fallacina TaxID=1903189 RepID=A0A8H3IJ92_9LECA|nr:MAG: hypothetical protein ALECFALPRED_004509 [Alectoria fallacina]